MSFDVSKIDSLLAQICDLEGIQSDYDLDVIALNKCLIVIISFIDDIDVASYELDTLLTQSCINKGFGSRIFMKGKNLTWEIFNANPVK